MRISDLGEFPLIDRIARIASAQDDLDATHHGAGRVRLRNTVPFHLRLDAQMALDTSDRINNNAFSHDA